MLVVLLGQKNCKGCKRLAEEAQYLAAELQKAEEYEKALDRSLVDEASFQEYLNEHSRSRVEKDSELTRLLENENKILLARIRTYLPSFEETDLISDMPTTSESGAENE
ncbi:hypothetical protein TELCIR_15499 [Teladorsagia circumcincta]|uniref:Uncharacterized protein n=1 Tax=Teladorsagia circumcincta TaxID=45464 RepID=A0A2G9TZP5_TELCI|nr:hypothetical protein TELCIR_15499 [Teladorsagia circumcincta]